MTVPNWHQGDLSLLKSSIHPYFQHHAWLVVTVKANAKPALFTLASLARLASGLYTRDPRIARLARVTTLRCQKKRHSTESILHALLSDPSRLAGCAISNTNSYTGSGSGGRVSLPRIQRRDRLCERATRAQYWSHIPYTLYCACTQCAAAAVLACRVPTWRMGNSDMDPTWTRWTRRV